MVLQLMLLALTVGLFIYAAYYFHRDVRKPLPGLEPSDPKRGNWGDIRRAGSIHEFLCDLHAKKGDIVSFWMGSRMAVSLASPELFKAFAKPYNRPVKLFEVIDMMGSESSIATAQGEEWRLKRALHDGVFGQSAMTNYFELVSNTLSELVTQLDEVPAGEHVGLMKCMYDIAFKNITRCVLGGNSSDENNRRFRHVYEACWPEVERHIAGDFPKAGTERLHTFNKMKMELVQCIKKAVELRRQYPAKPGEHLLIDTLIEHEVADETMCADLLAYLSAGYHTTGQLFVWLIYYIALHPEVEKGLCEEIQTVIGDGEVTPANIADLTYARQVIDETMRISAIGAYTGRILDEDFQLAGYTIPAKTPILQAIGAVMLDPKLWPEPHRFDPERFSPANASLRRNMRFVPFGFAGKRTCAGKHLTYLEATIFLSLVIPKFRFKVVEGQDIKINYSFVSKPRSEVWAQVERRM